MGKQYTAAQRTDALAALELTHGSNATRAASALGIPRPTLVRWRKEHEAVSAGRQMVHAEQSVDMLDTERNAHAERWAEVQRKLLARAETLVEEAESLRDVMVDAGIAADKQMDYSQGRKGATLHVDARSQHLHLGGHLSDEDREAIARRALRSLDQR